MPIRICFVCLGNICRSPTAEGVMRRLVAEAGQSHRVEVESAGTSNDHEGEPPDPRSARTARERGVEVSGAAQPFRREDFARFDHVIAMDRENEEALLALAPDSDARARVTLLRAFDPDSRGEPDVPDPYYGGDDGFDRVFEICESACRELLRDILRGAPPNGSSR